MFDLIDRIVSLSQLSNSKLKPAVGRNMSKGAPVMKLHTGAHTGASELLLAPTCGRLLWRGHFPCAQLLEHLHVPLMNEGNVVQWLQQPAFWVGISSLPVVNWVTVNYLLSLCYSFLIIKVEVIKHLTHRVDIIIKWDHVSESLSRMFDVVIKISSLQPLHSLYYASSLTHLQVQSIKCPWRSTDKNALAVWRREQLIWLWGTYRFFKWRGGVCSGPWKTNKKDLQKWDGGH